MMSGNAHTKEKKPSHILLKMVCVFAISYYGLASLFMGLALYFNEFVASLSMQYLPELGLTRPQVVIFLVAGLALNLGAVFGNVLVLQKRAAGIAVFLFSSVMVITFQYLLSGTEGWQKYALELGIIIFFLLFLPLGFPKNGTKLPVNPS